jgi:acyl carrier protein
MADVLGLDAAVIADSTSSSNVDSWDSLAHVRLVLALEGEFGIQFEVKEIESMTSYGEIAKTISQRVGRN